MRAFLIVIFMALSFGAVAQTSLIEHCYNAADYALTVKSLMVAGVEQKKLDHVLQQMYIPSNTVMVVAFGHIYGLAKKSGRNARDFSDWIGTACMKNGGRIESIRDDVI